MSDYKEYLSVTVLQENKPVTYKSLARALNIHVNKAKQALYEFATSESNIHAVYCITGTSMSDGRYTIKLVKDAELEDSKKKYKEITGIHVYSVTSFDPSDFSIFYTACKEAPKLSIEDRVKCGILRNTSVTVKNLSSPQQPIASSTTKSSNMLSSTSKPSSTQTSKLSSGTSTSKPEAKKRKGTLDFGPATTKKQAVATPANKEEPVSKPKPTPKSISKPSAKKAIDKMKPKDDHEDIERRLAKTSIRVSDIFSDDEDEDDNDEEEKENLKEPEHAEDIEIEEDDVEMEDAVEDKEEDTKAATPPPPGKARRKVLKKKTTRNARGFLVTEEVYEWETVDEDEVEPVNTPKKPVIKAEPAKPKASGNKKAANAKKPTGQSNLLSFFKKA